MRYQDLVDSWYTRGVPAAGTPRFYEFLAHSYGLIHDVSGYNSSQIQLQVTNDSSNPCYVPPSYTTMHTIVIPIWAINPHFYTEFVPKEDYSEIEKTITGCFNYFILHESLHAKYCPMIDGQVATFRTLGIRLENHPVLKDFKYSKELHTYKAWLTIANFIEDIYIEAREYAFANLRSIWLDIGHSILLTEQHFEEALVKYNKAVGQQDLYFIDLMGFYRNPDLRKLNFPTDYLGNDCSWIWEELDNLVENLSSSTFFDRGVLAAKIFIFLIQKYEETNKSKPEHSTESSDTLVNSATLQEPQTFDKITKGIEKGLLIELLDKNKPILDKMKREIREIQEEIRRLETAKEFGANIVDLSSRPLPASGEELKPNPSFERFADRLLYLRSQAESLDQSYYSRTGRLTNWGLTNYADSDIIFKRQDEEPQEIEEIQVALIGDISGSMNGSRLIRPVLTSLLGAGKSLRVAQIEYSIILHTSDGSSAKEVIYHAGTYGENWKHSMRGNLLNGIHNALKQGNHSNYDSEALKWMAKQFGNLPRTKLIFVLSDGEPCNLPGVRLSSKDYLKSIVAELRGQGFLIFGVALVKSVLTTNKYIYGNEWTINGSSASSLDRSLKQVIENYYRGLNT